MAEEEERSPIDDLVDILVYAPVGLLYEYEDVIPRLVRRGRSQVELARVIGKMAMDRGSTGSLGVVAEAMATMLAERITEIGAAIGLAPPAGEAGEEGGQPPSDRVDEPVSDRPDRGPSPGAGNGPTSEEGDGAADRGLPIASYDTLNAREIVGLLDELDAGQLARIRSHEEANRARKTVLGKLDRLGA